MELVRPGEPGFVDRRQVRRNPAELACTVRLRGRFAVAGVTADLTPVGARVNDAGPFPPGSEMWIRLPGLEGQPGRVVWSQLGATGVAFERALHPAVHARLLPDSSRLTLVDAPQPPSPLPPEIAGLPRREQIVRGFGAGDEGPLQRVKKPTGGGIATMIRRTAIRRAEHRGELRYADGVRTGPMRLQVDGVAAEICNVSGSGLKVAGSLDGGVGRMVEVAFEGFAPIPGRIVWRRGGELGLSLPPDSLDLGEA